MAISCALTTCVSCATVPEEAGFGDAAAVVRERGGHESHWNRGKEQSDEVDAQVRTLLADELDVEGAVQIALLRDRHLQAPYAQTPRLRSPGSRCSQGFFA